MSNNFGTQNLTAPANNAINQFTNLTLSWPANGAAASYDIQVATDVAFTSIIFSGNVVGTSHALNGLADATTYYWRVRAFNTGGGGCPGTATAGVTVTTLSPVPANAGPDQNLAACATTATLAATPPGAGSGAWSVVSGSGVVTTPSSATSGVTGIVPGTPLVLRWTTTNGDCVSFDEVTITSPVGPGCTVILVSGAGTNNVPCGTDAVLKDHAGDANYGANRNDWSVINAGLGATITLSGTYTTENNFDFIRIYNGSGIGGTLLATYTGTGTINYVGNPGQTLTIQFTSDNTIFASGFVVNVSYSGVCFPVCTTPTAQPTALKWCLLCRHPLNSTCYPV